MNDFTKEELKHIGDAIFYSMSFLDTRKDSLMTIRGKVLEMIENYCEHPESYRYTFDNKFSYCNKCNFMWKITND